MIRSVFKGVGAALPKRAVSNHELAERLAEKFHMDERFIVQLNPGVAFEPGSTIKVTVPAKPIKAKVARIIIDKQTSRVAAYDANGRLVADYPATVGSTATPSRLPTGRWRPASSSPHPS